MGRGGFHLGAGGAWLTLLWWAWSGGRSDAVVLVMVGVVWTG